MLNRIYQTLNSQFLRGFGFGIVLTGIILLIRTVAPLKLWVIISLSALLIMALGALIFHFLSTAAKKRMQSNLSVLADEHALDWNDLVLRSGLCSIRRQGKRRSTISARGQILSPS